MEDLDPPGELLVLLYKIQKDGPTRPEPTRPDHRSVWKIEFDDAI